MKENQEVKKVLDKELWTEEIQLTRRRLLLVFLGGALLSSVVWWFVFYIILGSACFK